MTIRSKHSSLFNYIAIEHKYLSPAYVKKCKKYMDEVSKSLKKRSKSLPGSS